MKLKETMKKIKEFMSDDHDRLEVIFKEFQSTKDKDVNQAKDLFHEFKTGLKQHIVWEEEILFPIFEDRTGMQEQGPTAVMRMEHRKIKEFLEAIHDNIVNADINTDAFERGLIEVLTAHNEKEEKILYPWMDNSLSETETEEAFERMEKV